jgi:uncharacterized protein (TIGR00297 family)
VPAAVKHIAIFAQVRIKGLSSSGTIAAIVVGLACAVAGFTWVIVLLAFYVSSTFLSRFHSDAKRERTGGTVEKSGDRDMWQVAANGGVFAAMALASRLIPSPAWYAAGAGAIAASAADTWATEIGVLGKQIPRSIASLRKVPIGTSGGVTLAGLVGSAAGALFIAGAVALLGWTAKTASAAIAGGIGGSLIDSLLGATIQSRRWCPTCSIGTERAVHTCGTTTVRSGGLHWLGNDMVNFFCSLAGAFLGYLCLA